jgi:hypothetical protein
MAATTKNEFEAAEMEAIQAVLATTDCPQTLVQALALSWRVTDAAQTAVIQATLTDMTHNTRKKPAVLLLKRPASEGQEALYISLVGACAPADRVWREPADRPHVSCAASQAPRAPCRTRKMCRRA